MTFTINLYCTSVNHVCTTPIPCRHDATSRELEGKCWLSLPVLKYRASFVILPVT